MNTKDKDVLERAITKAVEGGWRPLPTESAPEVWEVVDWYEDCLESIIFNHDFAKALWGTELTMVDEMRLSHGGNVVFKKPAWEAHLQQMVIADDQIAYLGENL